VNILGISAFYHDSAARLVRHGQSSPPRRKIAFRGSNTIPLFPGKPLPIACGRRNWKGGAQLDLVAF
jgi:hypothetical protein